MSTAIPLELWPMRLEAAIENCSLFHRVVVLRETDSTQNAARRLKARAGDVIVAWRQTSGRGRFGRQWADTLEAGVALTAVTQRDRPEPLVMATALALASVASEILGCPVDVKHPNDIVVDGRKLAGVLVEQTDQFAFIGIGMNVGQTTWPADLCGRAISFAQLHANADRLEVVEAILINLDRMLLLPEAERAIKLAQQQQHRPQCTT